MLATAVATLATALAVPLIYVAGALVLSALFGGIGNLNGLAFVVAIASVVTLIHVILLGLPAFFLLRRFNRLGAGEVGGAGFVGGSIPYAIWSWPTRIDHGQSSFGGFWWGETVWFIDHGMVTEYGWFSYLQGVLVWGFLGLVGALVFLLVWRSMRPNTTLERAGKHRGPRLSAAQSPMSAAQRDR